MADFGNSFEMVRATRVAPEARNIPSRLAVATLAPLPLLLTKLSLAELPRKFAAILD